MKPPPTHYRHRFPAEIIGHAVWLYHVFSLSLRDVELLLAERGIVVSYETVRRWCKQFGQTFASRLRHRRPRRGDKWYLDEVFIRIRGVQLAADAYRALRSVAFDVSAPRDMRPTRDMTRTDEPFWAPARPSEVNVTMPPAGIKRAVA